MNVVVTLTNTQSLPGLIDRAATALINARSSAEVLEARDIIIRERMRELAEDERAAREVA